MTEHSRPNWAPGMLETDAQEKELTDKEMFSFPSKNPHQAFLIGAPSRPGFTAFIQELEYFHYAPDTERNALFELIITKWQEMMWVTVAVPLKELQIAEELAKKYEFHLLKGTTPMAITPEGEEWFPMEQRENVFCVQGFIRDEGKVETMSKDMKNVIEAHTNKILEDIDA